MYELESRQHTTVAQQLRRLGDDGPLQFSGPVGVPLQRLGQGLGRREIQRRQGLRQRRQGLQAAAQAEQVARTGTAQGNACGDAFQIRHAAQLFAQILEALLVQ